jgi:hypothetical protein
VERREVLGVGTVAPGSAFSDRVLVDSQTVWLGMLQRSSDKAQEQDDIRGADCEM